MLNKEIFYACIYFLCFFCSKMSYRTIYKFKPWLNCTFTDFLYLFTLINTLNMSISSKFQINFVCIINKALCKIFPYKWWQISTNFIWQRQFSIRKCPGSWKTRCNIARFTSNTFFGFTLRTVSLMNTAAFFNHYYLFLTSVLYKFKCRKNTGWSTSYNNNICFHNLTLHQ